LRAADGLLLREFLTGDNPIAFAFDGEQTWLAHLGEDIVTHKDSNGQQLQSFLSRTLRKLSCLMALASGLELRQQDSNQDHAHGEW
jgi:hypothetical protein